MKLIALALCGVIAWVVYDARKQRAADERRDERDALIELSWRTRREREDRARENVIAAARDLVESRPMAAAVAPQGPEARLALALYNLDAVMTGRTA